MINQNINPKFVDFSKHVFILGKKYHERNLAKQDLMEHIKKIKTSSQDKKRKVLLGEFEHLEKKMAELIEKEKMLASSSGFTGEDAAELSKDANLLRMQLSMEQSEREKIRREIESKNRMFEEKEREMQEIKKMVASFRERLNALKKQNLNRIGL